jgi:hypothetical protein
VAPVCRLFRAATAPSFCALAPNFEKILTKKKSGRRFGDSVGGNEILRVVGAIESVFLQHACSLSTSREYVVTLAGCLRMSLSQRGRLTHLAFPLCTLHTLHFTNTAPRRGLRPTMDTRAARLRSAARTAVAKALNEEKENPTGSIATRSRKGEGSRHPPQPPLYGLSYFLDRPSPPFIGRSDVADPSNQHCVRRRHTSTRRTRTAFTHRTTHHHLRTLSLPNVATRRALLFHGTLCSATVDTIPPSPSARMPAQQHAHIFSPCRARREVKNWWGSPRACVD